MSDDVLARCAGLPLREVAPGEELVHGGDPGGAMYVLVSGAVDVERDGETIVSLTRPGSVIGELSVLLGRPANANVVATEPTTVHVVADAATALAERPDLLLHVAQVLARRVSAMTSYLVDLREQYAGTDGHLSMMDTVLSALLVTDPVPADAGSDREVPPY